MAALGDPFSVLLVEDNPDDAAWVTDTLSLPDPFCSYRVLAVGTLREALEALSRRRFDVVLLDLSLPDSFELRAVERIELADPALPIVVLSGSDDEALAIQAVQKGAQDYLLKGVTPPAVLKRALKYAVERKKYTNGLQEQNRKLQELDRMKSEFVAVVTHELRTPMSAIQLSMQLLDDELLGSLNAEQKEFLCLLRRNTERLSSLVTDVLSISRIESGQLQLNPRACDLNDLVAEVTRLLGVQAKARGSKLSASLGPGVQHVWCDPDAVTQVLVNLVSNALNHNAPGTAVVIRAVIQGQQALLSVEDNGKGIPLENQEDVFRPFFQIRDADARTKSGTGLGLAICRGLLAAHGVQLALESTPGQGCTFRFALPAYAPERSPLERQMESRLGQVNVKVEKYGAVVGVRIQGRLDTLSYRDFQRLTQEVFANWGLLVAVDLGECSGLDSRGLGLLLEVRAEALDRGGNLVLCAIPETLKDLVDRVGLPRTIPCFSSLPLAIGFLVGQGQAGGQAGRRMDTTEGSAGG